MSNFSCYTEEEWFDTFYPITWGNWRDEFNMKQARAHYNASACSWEDYALTGYVSGADENGIMKVNKFPKDYSRYKLDNFFIECGTVANEADVAYFIQPYLQQSIGTYFARVELRKEESNLALYKVYVAGNDDSSFSKHFIGRDDAEAAIVDIKTFGIDHIAEDDSGYFFTN